MKSLALASKPQVLENCPVLGSRTALFFEPLKFCWKAPETSQKICKDLFLFSSSENCLKKILKTFIARKKFLKTFLSRLLEKFFENLLFFGEHLRLCPWFLASRGSVLGLEIFCVFGLGLEPCVLDSTSAHTFPKKKQTFNFIRDSGNEFHILRDAYEHTIVVLVDPLTNLKLVIF